jgi:hypothetical protein
VAARCFPIPSITAVVELLKPATNGQREGEVMTVQWVAAKRRKGHRRIEAAGCSALGGNGEIEGGKWGTVSGEQGEQLL